MIFDTLISVIQDFLHKEGISALNGTEQIIRLTHAVSAIPWGEARAVEEVLTENVGTCTGKHLVLQACFDALGIEYQPVVCTFHWGKQQINLPSHLQGILDEGEWVHGHNFVQIRNDEGEWIDLDVTWDPSLAAHGFLALPGSWDGNASFVGLHSMINRWDGVSIAEKKEELIGSLSTEHKERRERFLKEFIQWIDSLR